jgi:hypothetical protein
MTEFTVSVYRNPTEHKIRLQHVLKWSEHTAKEVWSAEIPFSRQVSVT